MLAWTEAQNEFTRKFWTRFPSCNHRTTTQDAVGLPSSRDARSGRLLSLLFQERRITEPVARLRSRGAHGYAASAHRSQPLSSDGTVALDWWYPGEKVAYVAYECPLTEMGKRSAPARDGNRHGSSRYDGRVSLILHRLAPPPERLTTRASPAGDGFPQRDQLQPARILFHKLGTDPGRTPSFSPYPAKGGGLPASLSSSNRFCLSPRRRAATAARKSTVRTSDGSPHAARQGLSRRVRRKILGDMFFLSDDRRALPAARFSPWT